MNSTTVSKDQNHDIVLTPSRDSVIVSTRVWDYSDPDRPCIGHKMEVIVKPPTFFKALFGATWEKEVRKAIVRSRAYVKTILYAKAHDRRVDEELLPSQQVIRNVSGYLF